MSEGNTKTIEIYIVKAFSKNKMEGNPAGVVLDADDLTDNQMLKISKELGLSESAFVQVSNKADFKVRFFSPTQEVGICAHATIATFYTLLHEEKLNLGDKDEVNLTQEVQSDK